MEYWDIYKARLNRHGGNHVERLNNGREMNFDRFMRQSPHYLKFMHKDQVIECVFEPSSQTPNKTVMHVLCKVDVEFEPGDICTIGEDRYLFWYLDERKDSGYNRWTTLKISRPITWINDDKTTHESEAYIWGQMSSTLQNELKSRTSASLYFENNELDLMIMPLHHEMKIGSYLTVEVKGLKKHYRVTGFDHVSTPGIMYVSMDPTLERDMTPPPEATPDDDPNDFFWLGGVAE